MIMLQYLYSALFWTFLEMAIFLIYIFSWAAVLLFKYKTRATYACAKYAFGFVFKLFFIRFKLTGKENINVSGHSLILVEHPTLFDVFYPIVCFPKRLRPVADDSLFHVPILGRAMRGVGVIDDVVTRENPLLFAHTISLVIKENTVLMLSPAGISSAEGMTQGLTARLIAFIHALDVKVIPVALRGACKIISPHGVLVRPGIVELVFGKPVEVSEDYEKAIAELAQFFKENRI